MGDFVVVFGGVRVECGSAEGAAEVAKGLVAPSPPVTGGLPHTTPPGEGPLVTRRPGSATEYPPIGVFPRDLGPQLPISGGPNCGEHFTTEDFFRIYPPVPQPTGYAPPTHPYKVGTAIEVYDGVCCEWNPGVINSVCGDVVCVRDRIGRVGQLDLADPHDRCRIRLRADKPSPAFVPVSGGHVLDSHAPKL